MTGHGHFQTTPQTRTVYGGNHRCGQIFDFLQYRLQSSRELVGIVFGFDGLNHTDIRAGQKIARSGNTGFSSGPHLHFVIQQNTGMKLISLPFRFRAPEGATLVPEEMQLLQGTAGTP